MLQIERSIKKLHKNLTKMASLVLRMVSMIDTAIQKEKFKGLGQIFKDDKKLDSLEVAIDKLALEVLLEAPKASDLRFVFSVTKLTVDIERIGDECKNTARELLNLRKKIPISKDVKEISKKVYQIVDKCFRSLFGNDTGAAKKVILADDKIDKLEHEIIHKYEDTRNSIPLLFAVKALERMADHASNIAEKVIYNVEGADIRHRRTLSERKKKTKRKNS